MKTLYLDTETMGLGTLPNCDFVEVSIIDDDGAVLLDTLANPGLPIPAAASAIHGIHDIDVRHAPPSEQVRAQVMEIVRGHHVVIYNASYDVRFFPGIERMAKISCCMLEYSDVCGEWSDYHGSYKWVRLTEAARECGHEWTGSAHRALADCYASRTVWRWLRSEGDADRERCRQQKIDEDIDLFVNIQPENARRQQAAIWRGNTPAWAKALTERSVEARWKCTAETTGQCTCRNCRSRDIDAAFVQLVRNRLRLKTER